MKVMSIVGCSTVELCVGCIVHVQLENLCRCAHRHTSIVLEVGLDIGQRDLACCSWEDAGAWISHVHFCDLGTRVGPVMRIAGQGNGIDLLGRRDLVDWRCLSKGKNGQKCESVYLHGEGRLLRGG